jgi:MFS family permease
MGLSILAGSSLRYIMLNASKPEDRAVTQGMLTIFTSSGQLIGAAIFGLILGIVSTDNSFKYIFLTSVLSLIITLILAFRLKFDKKVEQSV